MTAKITR